MPAALLYFNVIVVIEMSGNNSVVECNLAKVEVASSNLVSRSIDCPRFEPVSSLFLFCSIQETPMKTLYTPVQEIDRKWFVVDADGKVLGRMATEIASRLRGKHKPTFCNFQDNGDFIVVINAEKIHLTGKKWDDKKYYHHTGYVGGIKEITAKDLLEKKPEELIRKAVKGMLPKNKLGRRQLKKLKIYAGSEHPHSAQQPESLDV